MNNKEIYDRAVELYRDWNDKINVVSRKDIDNLYQHHILHSLAIAEYVRRFYPAGTWTGESVLDAGTGGGFPGIPLAIEFPDTHFTLCDSIGKKIKVAGAIAEGLGLKNVTCVNSRAEQLPGRFDWVVSRAVSALDVFYPWVAGRFNRGILVLKGGDIGLEIDDLVNNCHVSRNNVRVWRISEWLKDDYFAEKFVIEIGKDYLCPPKNE